MDAFGIGFPKRRGHYKCAAGHPQIERPGIRDFN